MNCKRVIVGILGIVAVGCASNPAIKIVEDEVASRRQERIAHPEIKLKTIFGINEEMLADTNRFPVSSDHWYDFDLPEDMGGFKTVKFSLKDEKGKFGIFNVEMVKKLHSDSDDSDLLKEFKSAVDMVGRVVGIDIEYPVLVDVDEWRRHWGRHSDSVSFMRLDSDVRIELADGYSITIEAKDATYVKRKGELQLVANAVVEVNVRNNKDGLRRLRRRGLDKKKKPVAVAREVEFGIDLSQQLSEATKDEAKGRNAPEQSEEHSTYRITKMIKNAESGDVGAMNMLTWSYRFGHDVKADQNLAFKYSKMSADAGDARGVADLACCYEEGRGTKKDVVKAATLWKKAAEMGNAWAVSRYAKCLADGIGVEQDPQQAAQLFTMCASRPNADPWTVIQIASFYLSGFGVEKDEAKAREWLDKLEAQTEDDDSCAIPVLAKFYSDGEKGVGKDPARAFKMAQLAEKTDTVWGYKIMARCYKDGIGVEKNTAKAKEYIEKAMGKCKGGNCNLGDLKKMLRELDGGK